MHPPLWHIKPVLRALFRIPSDPAPSLQEPERWSAALASWIDGCLRKEPDKRFGTAALAAHAFLASVRTSHEQRAVLLPLATVGVAAVAAKADASSESARAQAAALLAAPQPAETTGAADATRRVVGSSDPRPAEAIMVLGSTATSTSEDATVLLPALPRSADGARSGEIGRDRALPRSGEPPTADSSRQVSRRCQPRLESSECGASDTPVATPDAASTADATVALSGSLAELAQLTVEASAAVAATDSAAGGATPGQQNVLRALRRMEALEAEGELLDAAELLAAAMVALKDEQDEALAAEKSLPSSRREVAEDEALAAEKSPARLRTERGAAERAEEAVRTTAPLEEERSGWSDEEAAEAASATGGLSPDSPDGDGTAGDEPQSGSTLREFFRTAASWVGPTRGAAAALRGGGQREMPGARMPDDASDATGRGFCVLDTSGTPRGRVGTDGTVTGPGGEVIAYIEADGRVGTVDLKYAGQVTGPCDGDVIGFAQDASDATVALVDYGFGLLRDPMGSVLGSIRASGEVRDQCGLICGTLEGFRWGALRRAAAYLLLVDRGLIGYEHALAAAQLSMTLTLWQRQQVTSEHVAGALSSLDDETVVSRGPPAPNLASEPLPSLTSPAHLASYASLAPMCGQVRLVEHGMLPAAARLQRRSAARTLADADGSKQAAARGLLFEQAARGGVRALMNIFLCALLGTDEDFRAPPALATQRSVLRGILFCVSLVTSGLCASEDGTTASEGTGSSDCSANVEAGAGFDRAVVAADGEAALCDEYLLETLLGLAFSSDAEVRHDTLLVLSRLVAVPRARAFLGTPNSAAGLCAIAASNMTLAATASTSQPFAMRPLDLSLQLLDGLLCGASAVTLAANGSAAQWQNVRRLLQPLALSLFQRWELSDNSCQPAGMTRAAHEAAARLLSWSAAPSEGREHSVSLKP